MKFLIAFASLLTAAQAISIASPTAGTILTAGQNVVVQLVRSTSTTAKTSIREISLVIGMAHCNATACPDASTDIGELLVLGQYEPQGPFQNNTHDTFDNFIVVVPKNISGPASIQVQHNFLIRTLSANTAEPVVEYTSAAVTIG